MKQWKVEADERELEQLFADSRRYPLLSAAQEQQIDGSKWRAIEGLLEIFLSDAGARDWLQQLLATINTQPLEIALFANREHHFLLRRELASYLPGGAQATACRAVAAALQGENAREASRLIAKLQLPASLVTGMGSLLLRRQGEAVRCIVADALQSWMETRSSHGATHPELAPEAQRALRLALSRYNQARDTLVLHNLRLVYAIAGKSAGKGASYRDLIQEGTLGLIRAAEKFEAGKGFRFSTYSYNWISQAIRRYLQDSAVLIRYPSHVRDQIGRLYREQEAYRAANGELPDEDTLARAAGVAPERSRALRQLRNVAVSLDAPGFEDGDEALLDQLVDTDTAPPDSTAMHASLHRHLLEEMAQLDPAEREVVIARWGLHRGRPLTRAEIADRLSVSREWVRQLENSALAKLALSKRLQDTAQELVSTP